VGGEDIVCLLAISVNRNVNGCGVYRRLQDRIVWEKEVPIVSACLPAQDEGNLRR
jgi:hypothetical protein